MKQTLKEVRAQLTNEISKRYREKYESEIESLRTAYNILSEQNAKLHKENKNLTEELEELEEKVGVYEDYIQRLQDFCNIPDEERDEEVKKYMVMKDISKELETIQKLMSPYVNCLFNI